MEKIIIFHGKYQGGFNNNFLKNKTYSNQNCLAPKNLKKYFFFVSNLKEFDMTYEVNMKQMVRTF